jgi:hypothetical protein
VSVPVVAARREQGACWELNFARLAFDYNRDPVVLHQYGRTAAAVAWVADPFSPRGVKTLVSPDVSLFGFGGHEHHEVKHKEATRSGCYGLEVYRLRSLASFARRSMGEVYYTIHDWRRAGAENAAEPTENRIGDWVAANVVGLELSAARQDGTCPSIVDGHFEERVPTAFWPTSEFRPLLDLWTYEP